MDPSDLSEKDYNVWAWTQAGLVLLFVLAAMVSWRSEEEFALGVFFILGLQSLWDLVQWERARSKQSTNSE